MIVGVTEGYEKQLELVGVGYRASTQGKNINLTLGFSHPVVYKIPDEIEIQTPSQTEIIIKELINRKLGKLLLRLGRLDRLNPIKGRA